jgi:hypothetical protein
MKYIYSYRFLFESPKWLTNLLAAVVCQFVPILGQMVLAGYAFEIIEALHRRKGSPYPDFDMNQLMKYLTRGVWPFLVQLVVGLPFAVIIMIGYVGCLGVGFALGGANDHPAVLFLFLMLFYLLVFVLSVLVTFVMMPLTLRSGLIQDFKPAFSVDFAKDFINRVWLEMILLELFLLGTGIVLSMVGMLACGVGIYPAAALMAYAHYHLLYQVYELYLERGGMPIPLKPEPVAAQSANSAADAPPPSAPPPETFKAPDHP